MAGWGSLSNTPRFWLKDHKSSACQYFQLLIPYLHAISEELIFEAYGIHEYGQLTVSFHDFNFGVSETIKFIDELIDLLISCI